jgi:hypothetical protein
MSNNLNKYQSKTENTKENIRDKSKREKKIN